MFKKLKKWLSRRLDENIDPKEDWLKEMETYDAQKIDFDALRWALVVMEKELFTHTNPSIEDVVAWIEKKEQYFEETCNHTGAIKDDRPMIAKKAKEVVQRYALVMPKEKEIHVIEYLTEMLAENSFELKDTLSRMISEIQYRFEQIRELICCPKPNWEEAGNIIMPMWETLVQKGVKHEILTRVKSFDGQEVIDGFGGVDNMIAELEERLLKGDRQGASYAD